MSADIKTAHYYDDTTQATVDERAALAEVGLYVGRTPEDYSAPGLLAALRKGYELGCAEVDVARRRAEREARDAAALRHVAEERDALRRELEALR